MKLHSIALAGLLGAGLLMTSGCSKDDVKDAVNDALKTNVIYVANANSGVNFTVDGVNKVVGTDTSSMFFVGGKDSYDVSNGVNNTTKSFPNDSAHLYGLCSDGNVVTDSAQVIPGPRQIDIINLSDKNITNGGSVRVTLKRGGLADVNATVTQSNACTKQVLTFSSQFALSEVTAVEVNGVSYTIPAYDADVASTIDSLNDVDFDIVVFNPATSTGTIVPLASVKDLGKL